MSSVSMLRAIFNTVLANKAGMLDLAQTYQEYNEKEKLFVNDLKYGPSYRPFNISDYYYKSPDLKIDWNMEIHEPQTLREEMLMSHDQYVVWLNRKYGMPKCNYFLNEMCTMKNQSIERLNEGLFLHHLAEECRITYQGIIDYKFGNSKTHALYNPDNFIYCNYLEHLLLHIKIMIEDLTEPEGCGTDIAGARAIWRELNGFFEMGRITLPNKKAAELIQNRYNDYIFILQCTADLIMNEPRCANLIELDDLTEDKNGVIMPNIYKKLFSK